MLFTKNMLYRDIYIFADYYFITNILSGPALIPYNLMLILIAFTLPAETQSLGYGMYGTIKILTCNLWNIIQIG